MKRPEAGSSHVRFTEDQYSQISDDARVYGKSIPDLLRAAYFGSLPPRPAFSVEDAKRIVAAINRVGNNVNQIARHLNSGFRSGFAPVLDEIRAHLIAIRNFTVGANGNSQNQVCQVHG